MKGITHKQCFLGTYLVWMGLIVVEYIEVSRVLSRRILAEREGPQVLGSYSPMYVKYILIIWFLVSAGRLESEYPRPKSTFRNPSPPPCGAYEPMRTRNCYGGDGFWFLVTERKRIYIYIYIFFFLTNTRITALRYNIFPVYLRGGMDLYIYELEYLPLQSCST